ncbi:hypothetical protein C6Y10_00545 [Lactiplantibacillus pentosus]|nr:hypothetical protein C6Y10_00545 [Lactiplantibacillus pentosus]
MNWILNITSSTPVDRDPLLLKFFRNFTTHGLLDFKQKTYLKSIASHQRDCKYVMSRFMPDRISNTLLFMLIILATFVSGVNDYVEIYFVWSGNAMAILKSYFL